MYDSVVKYVTDLADDKLPQVHLETMALCAAWLDSYRDQPDVTSPYVPLKQKLDVWVRDVEPSREETEGYRQQPLLRDLAEELTKGHLDKLRREELDILYFAWGLVQRSGKPQLFERIPVMIEPHIKMIDARRDQLPLSPGLGGLSQRIMIYTTEDIKTAAARDVKIFAGLDTPLRGPLLVASGDTKIIGDIPDGHGVAVEGGNVTVTGRVNGRLAATKNCEIHGPIAGVVVSRKGAIRARNMFPQSIAVAKEGSLMVTAIEGAKMAFGCNMLRVKHSVKAGTILGRCIEVGEEIIGGRVQTSEFVKAARFKNDEKRMSIVLRRGLSPQDYGEVLLIESLRLLTNAIKLRQKLSSLTEMHDLAEREADEYAGNVLVFLVGDEGSASRVANVQGLRRRLAYMSRLSATAHALVGYVEERVTAGQQTDNIATGAEERALMDDLQKELGMLATEGQVEVAVQEAQKSLVNFVKRLSAQVVLPQVLLKILEEVSEKHREFSAEVLRLEQQIIREEGVIEGAAGKTAILDRAKEAGHRVSLLNQLTAAARAKPGAGGFQKKLTERYVKIMQRNIEARLAHATTYRSAILQTEQRIEAIRDKLWTEFQISLPLHVIKGWNRDGAKAVGQFESNIMIVAWPHLVEEGRAGESGVLVTPGLGNEVLTYRRSEKGGIERV